MNIELVNNTFTNHNKVYVITCYSCFNLFIQENGVYFNLKTSKQSN